MRWRGCEWMLVLWLWLSVELPSLAQQPPPDAQIKPEAALLDLSPSPITAQLEAELLAANMATWVERTEINRVLDEQKLQALFAADAGGERTRLGRILNEDLLIFIHSGTAGDASARSRS